MTSNDSPSVPLDEAAERPPVDPGLEVVLALVNAPEAKAMVDMTPQEARESFKLLSAVAGEPPAGLDVAGRSIPGPAGEIPVRVYLPADGGPTGVLVYFHGGGFVIGDLDTHDDTCRRFAVGAGCAVVSVDYRLAPEAPAPAAVDDCWAATTWVVEHRAELGASGLPVAVGGDSAGGNLSAVVAQRAVAEGVDLAAQVLIYPAVDATGDTDSHRRNGEGYFLTTETMAWFFGHYAAGGASPDDPAVAPIRATDDALTGVAPALVHVAGYDPLRDEGIAYADRLRGLGVEVELREYPTMIHGFYGMGALTPVVDDAFAHATDFLRRRLG
jgi:acetyl esterase